MHAVVFGGGNSGRQMAQVVFGGQSGEVFHVDAHLFAQQAPAPVGLPGFGGGGRVRGVDDDHPAARGKGREAIAAQERRGIDEGTFATAVLGGAEGGGFGGLVEPTPSAAAVKAS